MNTACPTIRITHVFEDGSDSSGSPDPDFARHLVLAETADRQDAGMLPWNPSADGQRAVLVGDLTVPEHLRGHGIATRLVLALREHRPDLTIDPGDTMTWDGQAFWQTLPASLLQGTPPPSPDWNLQHQHVSEPQDPEADISDMDDYDVLTAQDRQGRPLGFVRYTRSPGGLHLLDVHAYVRRQRVATFLLDALRARHPRQPMFTEDFTPDGLAFRNAYWRLRGNSAYIEAAYE